MVRILDVYFYVNVKEKKTRNITSRSVLALTCPTNRLTFNFLVTFDETKIFFNYKTVSLSFHYFAKQLFSINTYTDKNVVIHCVFRRSLSLPIYFLVFAISINIIYKCQIFTSFIVNIGKK